MKAGWERGKGQIMLSEEWLRMIQEDRQREIDAAERVRAVGTARRADSRLRSWLHGDSESEAPQQPARAQAGRPATDPSA